MYRYATDNSRVFERRAPEVAAVIGDLESWNLWWPREVRFRIVQLSSQGVGSKFEVLLGGRSFSAELERVELLRGYHWGLREGAWRGRADWTLEPVEDHVKVKFALDVTVHPVLIGEHFLSAKDFSSKVSRLMKRVFDGMDHRAGELRP